MCCSALLCLRFAVVQELRFETEKRSGMGCGELQGGLFTDFQEWYSQAAKRLYKSSTILEDGRFANVKNRNVTFETFK